MVLWRCGDLQRFKGDVRALCYDRWSKGVEFLRLGYIAVRGRGGVSIEVDSACRVDDGIWRWSAPRLNEALVSHH